VSYKFIMHLQQLGDHVLPRPLARFWREGGERREEETGGEGEGKGGSGKAPIAFNYRLHVGYFIMLCR